MSVVSIQCFLNWLWTNLVRSNDFTFNGLLSEFILVSLTVFYHWWINMKDAPEFSKWSPGKEMYTYFCSEWHWMYLSQMLFYQVDIWCNLIYQDFQYNYLLDNWGISFGEHQNTFQQDNLLKWRENQMTWFQGSKARRTSFTSI